MKKLTPKQEKFCQLYVELGNASDAYRGAYNVSPETTPASVHSKSYEIKQKLKEYINIIKNGGAIEFKPLPKPTKGYVYLLHLVGFDFYKIGVSRHVPTRVKQLNTLVPFDIHTLKVINIENYRDIEKQMHKSLDKYRYKGEWFKGCVGVMLKEFNKYD